MCKQRMNQWIDTELKFIGFDLMQLAVLKFIEWNLFLCCVCYILFKLYFPFFVHQTKFTLLKIDWIKYVWNKSYIWGWGWEPLYVMCIKGCLLPFCLFCSILASTITLLHFISVFFFSYIYHLSLYYILLGKLCWIEEVFFYWMQLKWNHFVFSFN